MTAAAWEALAEQVRGCVRCPELVANRTTVVPGVRPPGARVLLVGEAPGAQEDLAGEPFVGRSGQLLDVLLAEAGLPRADVAVTNVVKCRPPGNRAPRRAEVASCRPWLTAQLAIADPEVVVSLGSTALAWFLGPAARIAAARDVVHDWHGRRLVATYHPSAAVRFGPRGAPRAALRDDLSRVARLLQHAP